ARDADLVAESFERLLVVRHGFGEKLERDRLVEREVVGAVDLAHPALPEHGNNSIASAEQLPGSESSLRAAAGVPGGRRAALAVRTGRPRRADGDGPRGCRIYAGAARLAEAAGV